MIGTYEIMILLSDTAGGFSINKLVLEMIEAPVEVVEEQIIVTETDLCQVPDGVLAPDFRILSVNMQGLVTIEWTKPMIQPNNWQNISFNATNSALEFELKVLNEEIVYNWWFKSFNSKQARIQFNFTDPQKVSSSSDFDEFELVMI